METLPFDIEMEYNAPVEKVWKAIANPDDMKQWYFDLPSFTSIVAIACLSWIRSKRLTH